MADEVEGAATAADVKKSKAEKLKDKKKRQKENKKQRRQQAAERGKGAAPASNEDAEDVVIEYVSAPLELTSEPEEQSDAMEEDGYGGLGLGAGGLGFTGFTKPKPKDPMEEFKKVFEKFAPAEVVTGAMKEEEEADEEAARKERLKETQNATTSGAASDDEDDDNKASKKKRKELTQMKIAELKQLCERPEVVEVWDVTSQDPALLVFLKAVRNTVAVPRHWSQKRKYLQGKRGIEKPAFKLPDFIEATGITQMRQSYQEKEEAKKLKAKQRDKMQPKMGRMDIDYQVLHDAFFKHQTKPKLTGMGELYYEGKEYEAHVENLKPGVLSDALRAALGMTENSPPPWLINMQRYGPPPSYPNLKIPGLNAPIPPGAQFGYQPGGWGKPPVDEEGNPLYGDVFGQYQDQGDSDDEIDKAARWGELEPDLEESSEEEEEEEEGEGMQEDELADGIASGIASGLASGMVSGLSSGIASSLPSGIETPDMMVNLRKGTDSTAPALYTVLEQKQVSVGAGNIMGSDHVYVIPGQDQTKKDKKRPDVLKNLPSDVEVTLTPEEMEGLDEAALKALYEERVAEAKLANRREDFSDLVAAKAAQQKRKLEQQKSGAAAKKQKDFKF